MTGLYLRQFLFYFSSFFLWNARSIGFLKPVLHYTYCILYTVFLRTYKIDFNHMHLDCRIWFEIIAKTAKALVSYISEMLSLCEKFSWFLPLPCCWHKGVHQRCLAQINYVVILEKKPLFLPNKIWSTFSMIRVLQS